MVRRILFFGLAVMAPLSVALAGGMQNVKLREATVRSGPKHFKQAIATVHYGDRLEVLDEKDGWLRVRTPGGAVGFLHATAVTPEPLPTRPPDAAAVARQVSGDEVALAGKGFNPQVERKYREQNPNLAEGFARVDALEARRVDPAELERFLAEGSLGEYGRRP